MKLRQKLYLWAASVLMVLTAVSCADDKTTTTVEVSGHCAITSVVLGNLQRTITTVSEATGRDTSFVVSVAGAVYPMYIDQLKHEIYNPDSLPINTRADKVLLNSISGDGEIYYRTASGRDTLYTGKDTLDFTNPIKFTCYSYDGTQSQSYTMHVNVHKVSSEVFTWSQVGEPTEAFADVTSQKAFALDGQILIIAIKGGEPVCISNTKAEPDVWTVAPMVGLPAIDPAEVQLFKGAFYAIADGKLMKSADAQNWTDAESAASLTKLLAASDDELYAYNGSQLLASADGSEWQADAAIDDYALLPQSNVVAVCAPMAFNSNFSYVILGGADAEGRSVIWKKTIDKTGLNTDPWTIYPQSAESKYNYPAYSQSVLMNYDSQLYSLGLNEGQLTDFYVSADGGRNWIAKPDLLNDSEAEAVTSFGAVVDADNYIWLTCAPSGKVLKGRLNRLSFDKNQTVFLKGQSLK